jgi:hypothetical protein
MLAVCLRRPGKGDNNKMSETTQEKIKFFTYKGLQLVRCGDVLYYGSMTDDYVAMLQILSKQKTPKLEVADKIKVYLMSTDEKLNPIEAIKKQSEKNGLYEALDLAGAWLERAKREGA